ncbi:MAG: class A beta-lactamase-related serine hydrolase [Gemmataceae bacterium]|nr:class A beta-lactamase-related serine hydrolase [Gemmataceae bacterium]
MLLAFLLVGLAGQTPEIQAQVDLKLRVERALQGFGGKVWLAASNLNTGKAFELNGGERVRTASTIKLAILVALHGEVKKGNLRWDDKLVLDKEVRAQGAGVLHEMEDGHTLTLREASRLMMVVSDNIATNLILRKVGIDTVNDWMDRLGLPKTRALAWIGGGAVSKARSAEWNKRADGSTHGIGVTTPLEMVDRNLRGVRIASKPGALDRLRSEVGILTVGKEKFALAVTIDDMPAPPDWSPDNPGLKMLSKLSEVLVDGLKSDKPAPVGEKKP